MRVAIFSAVMALATGAAVASEYFTGDGTSYTLGQVSAGNCNFMSAIPTASNNYVALNQEQWESLTNCGRCVEVSCIDSRCSVQNTTAVVQILDRCPECKHGDLDLSPTVYKTITGSDPARLTVQWRFVDCPNPGTIKVCLKEGSNDYWLGVQPTNFVVGVKSLTINGLTPTMLDGAYYFTLQDGSGVDLSALKVSITSINGDVVTKTVSLSAGSCVDTGLQFGSSTGSESDSSATSAPATTTSAPAVTTSAPAATTTAPTSSTTAPATTTAAPAVTTAAPVADESESAEGEYDESDEGDDDTTVTSAPVSTTAAPVATTAAPAATTSAPAATTVAPAATTATPSKCRVRSRK